MIFVIFLHRQKFWGNLFFVQNLQFSHHNVHSTKSAICLLKFILNSKCLFPREQISTVLTWQLSGCQDYCEVLQLGCIVHVIVRELERLVALNSSGRSELQELLLTKFQKWKWIKMAYFDWLPKLWRGTWNKHRPILVLDKSCMWLRYTQLWAKMRQQWNNHMVSLEVANDLSPNITKCLSQNIYH